MAIPTVALNETTPAGGAYVRDGNDRIIEYKIQVREILTIDHYFPSSGQNDACGRHKQMTLIEAADIGTGVTDPGTITTILGAQTCAGKAELMYTDEDNTDVQITASGKLNAAALGGVYAVTNLAALVTIMAYVYPVGSVYISVVSTNPGTLLGFGTWTAFGTGRTLVGIDSGQTEFDVVEETGGEKTHTLTSNEMPSHRHSSSVYGEGIQGSNGWSYYGSTTPLTGYSDYTGGGAAHNNLQPYIVVYMWKRTA